MPLKPQPIAVPPASALHAQTGDADFHDAYRLPLDPGERPMLAVCRDVLFRAPAWVEALMALRNRLVRWVGLKDLGRFSAIDPARPLDSYRVGDRLGIFTIVSLADDEVVLGDNDRHLNVQVAVCRLHEPAGARAVAVSTVVHVHNALGRLYMLFVGPAHKLIAPAVLSRARFAA